MNEAVVAVQRNEEDEDAGDVGGNAETREQQTTGHRGHVTWLAQLVIQLQFNSHPKGFTKNQ